MRVSEILVNLDSNVRCQIFRNIDGITSPIFTRPHAVAYIRNHTNEALINSLLSKDAWYICTIENDVHWCYIYLNREAGSVNENDLTTFFKKLDPDTYVNLRIWYGDPKDDAGEFFLMSLCGADYRPAYYCFSNIYDLFERLEISKISYRADKGIFLDCVKRRTNND